MIAKSETIEKQWLVERSKGIGSSDAPAVLGCGYATQSITQVYESKVNGVEPEFSDETKELLNEGKLNEPLVQAAFAARNPEWIVEPYNHVVLVAKCAPYILSSLDSKITHKETGERCPLECKWVLHPKRKVEGEWVDEWANGGTPLGYEVQARHQMITVDSQRGCLAAFVCGRWEQRWFERDAEIEKWMLEEYRKFWSHVLRRVPPPDDHEGAQAIHVREQRKGCAKLLGKKAGERVTALLEVNAEIEKLGSKATVLQNVIAQEFGGVEFLVLPNQSVVKISKTSIRKVSGLPRGVEILD